MATIKAGTYRFNDVLTAPSGDIREFVDFSVNITSPSFGDINLKADRFDVYADGTMDYVVVESQPDLSAYGASFPLTVGVWNGAEWSNAYQASGTQTITLPNDSEVSTEFAEWFSANAAPVVEHTVSGAWKFKDVLTNPDIDRVESLAAQVKFRVVGLPADAEFDLFNIYHREGTLFEYFYIITSAELSVTVYADGEYEDLANGTVSFNHEWFTYPELGFPDSNIWKTIDFGTEPQTVSAEFYNWLTANATQPMASVSHNGEEIASLFPGQTATLKCAGMKMAGDVVVSVAEQKVVEAVEDYDGTITIV